MSSIEMGIAVPVAQRDIQLEPFEALSRQNREDTGEAREFALQFNPDASEDDTVYTPWVVLNEVIVPREGPVSDRYTSVSRAAAFVAHWTIEKEEFVCDSARVDTFILANVPEEDMAVMLDPKSVSTAFPTHEYTSTQGRLAHTFRAVRSESLAQDEIMKETLKHGFTSIVPPINAWRRRHAQKSMAGMLDHFEGSLDRLKKASKSPVRNPQLEGVIEQPSSAHGAEM